MIGLPYLTPTRPAARFDGRHVQVGCDGLGQHGDLKNDHGALMLWHERAQVFRKAGDTFAEHGLAGFRFGRRNRLGTCSSRVFDVYLRRLTNVKRVELTELAGLFAAPEEIQVEKRANSENNT